MIKDNYVIELASFGSKFYNDAVKIREQYLRKPLGLSFTEDELKSEANHICFIAIRGEEVIATVMLIPQKYSFKLRQLIVCNQARGLGIGQALVNHCEIYSLSQQINTIEMNARKTAVEFYKKCGYKIVSDEFTEVSIPHFKMSKKLERR